MTWGYVAVALGTVIVGAVSDDRSSKRAENAQTNAANTAALTQREQYQQQRNDTAPWREAGSSSIAELMYGMGLGDQRQYAQGGKYDPGGGDGTKVFEKFGGQSSGGMMNGNAQKGGGMGYGSMNELFNADKMYDDPGYNFRMNEGLKAINSSASAKGMRQSGATLKALTRYGQDYASSEYGRAYDRYNQEKDTKYNRLSNLAGLGQTANNQIGQAGQNYANNAASIQIGLGNAQAAQAIAQGNSQSNTINQAGQIAAYGVAQNQNNNNNNSGG